MATTATISASTTTPVVGRSMNLIGTSGTSKNSNSSKTKAVPAPVTTISNLSQAALMSLPSPPASVSAPSPPGSASDDDLLPTPCASAEVSPVASPAASPVASPETKTVALPEEPIEESAGHSSTPTTTPSTTTSLPASAPSSTLSAEATTFFDDMINAPQPPANILSLSPTTSLPDLYHDFFDNHPELYDSDQSSDPEMDLEDLDSPLIRARTMADLRRETVPSIQAPLIADRPKLETIDTINLMLQHNPRPLGTHDQNQASPQRRKKASRACFHCQKAHLTCDDSRPCQRCVKRDLAGTCADGVRKKAKYLQEAMDSQQQAAEEHHHHHHHDEMAQTTMEDPSSLGDASLFFVPSTLSTAPTTASALTNEYGFGSEAVNLEYSILSTMLSSSSPPPSSLSSSSSSSHQLSAMTDLSMIENWQRQSAIEAMANSLSQRGHNHQLQRALLNQHHQQQQQQQQQQQGNSNDSHLSALGSGRSNKRKFPSNTPENVYANTKQPFNYTEGFHYLLRYVREKMDKEEMMRICRAMAMFRPSFIALIMNLTPEDLIFMETCFQRTVLEFEKLISFSGTPTVVWRRTGEIALVGKEFSLLTQWSREQLVPSQGSGKKKTYIYELMDNQSAVEYWEKFSTHAFENTEQTVMTTCILLSPTQRVVPCTFCFTIKRDIFDIPLAIVGNFLPILS